MFPLTTMFFVSDLSYHTPSLGVISDFVNLLSRIFTSDDDTMKNPFL